MGTGVAPTLESPAKWRASGPRGIGIGGTPSPAPGPTTTKREVDRVKCPAYCVLPVACSAWSGIPEAWLNLPLGVVKPHGRLGPVCLESVAARPHPAYRRRSLRRPFRELEAPGEFILGRASHLDAFSGYHSRSSLPGGAPGGTAGTRADRPTRSSRTRVRSPQHSHAHDGYRPNCLTTF